CLAWNTALSALRSLTSRGMSTSVSCGSLAPTSGNSRTRFAMVWLSLEASSVAPRSLAASSALATLTGAFAAPARSPAAVAAAGAGTGHRREVDALLAGQTAHERGDIRGVLAHGRSGGCRSSRCFDSLSGLGRRSRLSGHRLVRLRCGLLLGRFLLRSLL